MMIEIPEPSLVCLIGASASGKSTFARTHFGPSEIVSSDVCRYLVSDDENDLTATKDAFDVLRYLAGKRLGRQKLTVVDATSLTREARQPLVELARAHHVLPIAIVFDLPEPVLQERNRRRADRHVPTRVIRRHSEEVGASLGQLESEGLETAAVLRSVDEVDGAQVVRRPSVPA
jgi:predicted kinase